MSTLFVVDLPKEYLLSDLAELFQQFGTIVEMRVMQDGHVLVRYSEPEATDAANDAIRKRRDRSLNFQGAKVGIMVKGRSRPPSVGKG